MFCDLHTHSIFSDGTSTPQELIDGAIAAHLGAIALTDHNTVQGLPEFMAAADGKNIDIVLGSEFSVNYGEKELHLLGLFIDPKYFPQITDLMASILVRKEKSNIDLIGALGRETENLKRVFRGKQGVLCAKLEERLHDMYSDKCESVEDGVRLSFVIGGFLRVIEEYIFKGAKHNLEAIAEHTSKIIEALLAPGNTKKIKV